ncbi:MAG: molecular chaperone DnaJ [Anaerolineae bacterium]|nr:molecular chaperone DnaJ [Anaerolineae bacterium]
MPQDYYDVLGVQRTASKNDIKQAFRRLARQYHPDVSDAPDAEERFKAINEAYTVLSDDDKRATYDRFGHAGLNGMPGGFGGFSGGFPGFDEIFEEFFGGFGGFGQSGRRRRRSGPTQGQDLRYDMTIDFEQAVFGAEVDIEVPRRETCDQCGGSGAAPGSAPRTCPDCGGSGQVRQVRQTFLGSMVNITDCARCGGKGQVVDKPCEKCSGGGIVHKTRKLTVSVPPGVDDGTQIRLSGEGEPGKRGGPSGDLYVVLRVNSHEFFKRRNNDVILEVSINVAQAALGDIIQVPTVDGDEEVQLAAGTQSGKMIRLRNKGIPKLRRDGTTSGRGDQLVVVTVDIPTKLTKEQRDLFEQLSRTLGREVVTHKAGRGFMDRVADFFNS